MHKVWQVKLGLTEWRPTVGMQIYLVFGFSKLYQPFFSTFVLDQPSTHEDTPWRQSLLICNETSERYKRGLQQWQRVSWLMISSYLSCNLKTRGSHLLSQKKWLFKAGQGDHHSWMWHSLGLPSPPSRLFFCKGIVCCCPACEMLVPLELWRALPGQLPNLLSPCHWCPLGLQRTLPGWLPIFIYYQGSTAGSDHFQNSRFCEVFPVLI